MPSPGSMSEHAEVRPSNLSASRLAGLDVLRGVAIGMVLLTHASVTGFGECDGAGCGTLTELLLRIQSLGKYGVDLFFVLSGFLISSLLYAEMDRSGRIDLPRFWLRRGLKIWPSYYVIYVTAVAFISITVYYSGTSVSEYLTSAWSNYVFLQNYVNPDKRWFASWSLCVEEHFYLVLPLVLLFLSRMGWQRRGIQLFCYAACVICLAWRLAAITAGTSTVTLWEQTHFRFDALCFGVLLSHVYRYSEASWARLNRSALVACCIALSGALIIGLIRPEGLLAMEGIGLTLLYVGFGFLLVRILNAEQQRFVRSRALNALRVLGVYSYTIYLAQVVALIVAKAAEYGLNHIGLAGGAMKPLIFIATSILLGVLSSYAVERPFLRWRSHVLPSS
jgi:peptidoglycan/LPS O-acetylase OafA/YrhL